jgi:hypothetical protein
MAKINDTAALEQRVADLEAALQAMFGWVPPSAPAEPAEEPAPEPEA